MHYQHYDLGHLAAGMDVRVELVGNTANVRLMDEPNYQRFRKNQRYSCLGGRPRTSPYDLPVTHAGHWHVAFDHGLAGGPIKSSVSVLS